MTVKEFYEFVKSCGFEDCPLRVTVTDDSEKRVGKVRVDVGVENTSVYHDEVIIYP